MTSILLTLGSALLWGLAALAYWIGYRTGQQGERELRDQMDAKVERDRVERDADIKKLTDAELDARLNQWMRNHNVDPNR